MRSKKYVGGGVKELIAATSLACLLYGMCSRPIRSDEDIRRLAAEEHILSRSRAAGKGVFVKIILLEEYNQLLDGDSQEEEHGNYYENYGKKKIIKEYCNKR